MTQSTNAAADTDQCLVRQDKISERVGDQFNYFATAWCESC